MSDTEIHEAFDRATWVGFDLDETLHDFRGASSEATQEVLLAIYEYSKETLNIDDLRATYSGILRQKTASAFTDGKTSHEYRAERFCLLLSQYGIPKDEELVQRLVGLYENHLSRSLALKPGAENLLDVVRKKGKQIMVITEGPQDAQERTVQQLLGDKIDCLVTTNKIGLSKIDGLFPKVLDLYKVAPSQMVYIGDSLERDIHPATRAGIFAVHFDEKNTGSCVQGSYRTSSLVHLGSLL